MQVDTLMETLRVCGFSLQVTAGGLKVAPASRLTDDLRLEIRTHKIELITRVARIEQETAPYISQDGELVFPNSVGMDYRYWSGGQSIASTLAELRAPKVVWAKYVRAHDGLVESHRHICSRELETADAGILFCPECRLFTVAGEEECLQFEERAAVLEFDAGFPREEAEYRSLLEKLGTAGSVKAASKPENAKE